MGFMNSIKDSIEKKIKFECLFQMNLQKIGRLGTKLKL